MEIDELFRPVQSSASFRKKGLDSITLGNEKHESKSVGEKKLPSRDNSNLSYKEYKNKSNDKSDRPVVTMNYSPDSI